MKKLFLIMLLLVPVIMRAKAGIEFHNTNIYSVTQDPTGRSLTIVLHGGNVVIHGDEFSMLTKKIGELTLTVDRFRGDGGINDSGMNWEKQVATIVGDKGLSVSVAAFGTTVMMENGVISYVLAGRLYLTVDPAK